MHKLLLRQMKRYVGSDAPTPEEWKSFIDTVDEAYHQADTDRALLERSMDLTSQELLERNQQLRQDITERERTEEVLRESELQYRTLFEAANDAIFTMEQDRFTDCNSKTLEMFGVTREQILGQPPYRFSPLLQPDGRDSTEKAIEKIGLALQGKPQFFEWTHTRYDGTPFPAEVSLSRIEIAGEVLLQAIVRDITERKRTEEALRKAHDEATRHTANLERRTMQLQVAAEVSRAASSILDLDELLPQAVELICERFGFYYAGVFLADEAGKYTILRAGTGEPGRKMLEAGHRLEIGGASMIGWCMANQQARIALDVGKEAVRFDNPFLPETHSEMALPLTSRGEAIGAMTIQSTQEAAFSGEDIAILQTTADQLANAIQNARLFRQTQESLQEVEAAHRRYMREAWEEYTARQPKVLGYEYDLSQVLPLQETPPVEPATALSEGHLVTQSGGDEGEGTTLLAPITLGGEPIGVLGFQDPERPRHWTPDEIDLIETVSDQLALALENRRLFEQTQRALRETEILYHASQTIGATTSPGEVGQALMDYAATSGVDVARVLLFEHDEQGRPAHMVMCEGWTVDDRPAQPHGTRLSMEDYPLANLLDSNEPIVIEDVLTDPRANEMTRIFIANISGLRSFVMVPITVGERWIGTIFIGRNEPSTFAEELVRGYWTLAGQAAIALENVRLLEETRQHAVHMEALAEIGQAIGSILNLDEVLQLVLAQLEQVIPYDTVTLWLREGETMHIQATRGFETPETFIDLAVPIRKDRLFQELVYTRQPLIIADAQQDERFHGFANTEWVRSWLGVPLLSKDKVIGLLTIDKSESDFYTTETAGLAFAFSQQAALAIDNARMFEETQRRAEQERLTGEVTRRMRASLDVETVLKTAAREIGEALGLAALELQLGTEAESISGGWGSDVLASKATGSEQ